MRSRALLGVALAALLPGAVAGEGMWMPEQVPALGGELVKMGLQIPPERLADLTGDPMGAIVSLGGCSASFVSPQGLVVTNHHCVYGYLQYNSTPQKNLLEDGFLARKLGEEIPASPDARVYVTTSIEDVTPRVLPKDAAQTAPAELARRVDRRKKELVAQCEKEPGTRCLVPAFFEGSRYWLIRQLEIRDVRLVYAPPRGIGNYGGEVDNWMWPRHTGDFGFLRAYVAPDGRAAGHSPANVPYRPKHWLKVSSGDVDRGDLMMTIGYPGKTYRYRLAEEVRDAQEFELPEGVRYRRDLIRLLEAEGQRGKEVAIRNASRIRSFANYLKKYEGTLEDFREGNLVARREAEEREMVKMLAADPASRRRYEEAIKEIGRWNAVARANRQRDEVLEWMLASSPKLSQANTLLKVARERSKTDLDRAAGYQERDWAKLEGQIARAQRQIEPGSDRAGLRLLLTEAARLPAGQRIASVDEAIAATGPKENAAAVEALLDRLYSGTKIGDLETRRAMFEEPVTRILARNDSMIAFAAALRRDLDEKDRREQEHEGAMLKWKPVYVAALQQKRGGLLYPDANGSLRVSFGRVEGYSPRDSVVYAAQTTLRGILEKETGKDPFDSPELLLAASRERRLGPYVDPDLAEVPVNFLSGGDITNGSSGSATLNARGELAGLAFDGNYEAMGSDYLLDPKVARTIHVDSRYMLWVMDAVDGAHNLLAEMGLPAHFPKAGSARTKTAAP